MRSARHARAQPGPARRVARAWVAGDRGRAGRVRAAVWESAAAPPARPPIARGFPAALKTPPPGLQLPDGPSIRPAIALCARSPPCRPPSQVLLLGQVRGHSARKVPRRAQLLRPERYRPRGGLPVPREDPARPPRRARASGMCSWRSCGSPCPGRREVSGSCSPTGCRYDRADATRANMDCEACRALLGGCSRSSRACRLDRRLLIGLACA